MLESLNRMNNTNDNIATYVLFGDEAISIYKVSIMNLLKTDGINYKVGKYFTVKSFFEEKNKWKNYTEINFSDYLSIKMHIDSSPKFHRKKKKRFSFFKLFK